MIDPWRKILQQLEDPRQLTPAGRRELLAALETADPPRGFDLPELLTAVAALVESADPSAAEPTSTAASQEPLLGLLAAHLQQAAVEMGELESPEEIDEATLPAVERLSEVYRSLPDDVSSRYRALQALAAVGTPGALSAFAELIAQDPPRDERQADLAFAPLWRHPRLAVDRLYPALWDALPQETVASLVLDLANLLYRRRVVNRHPAGDRVTALMTLFGQLADRMKSLEERPSKYVSTPAELQQVVQRSVALGAALADALGLAGDRAAIPPLRRALVVGHRRIRAEAAAALAALGEPDGVDVLVTLAADPAARVRSLAYLEELNQLDAVPAEHRTPQARAAGETAAMLSSPTQFGVAPSELELVDEQQLRWPGYEQPLTCFLFTYEYALPGGSISGVAISGPLTHALHVDLEDLPPTDIYAVYCGWHVEHDEIWMVPAERASDTERASFRELVGRLADDGYSRLELALVGHFFSETMLVAQGFKSEQPGVLVAGLDGTDWQPTRSTRQPMGPPEAWYLHAGRKILRSFNPQLKTL